ncbi:heterokaryon incompatibility protein-domain-containing protein [Lasiosphaeris hirsuta]|uniref:Heterokaryon incompatibility protein-domain-containing protein n=1 Tax=Lasiosphaeris hirsuta TaxID=260670 RepID=A0AA40B1X5_9PEZI|nr:heterokaryon incompatibility protein-domain-containing protein [Lasiosphaeris hirsuta]
MELAAEPKGPVIEESLVTGLCSFCAKIPFKELRHDTTRFNLGRSSRVLASRCKFCRLVCYARTLSQQMSGQNIHWSEGGEVEVDWNDNCLGFGGHGAFSLTGCWEVFIGFSSLNEAENLPSYSLLPSLPGQLDTQRTLRWIDYCASNHDGCVSLVHEITFKDTFLGLNELRFIDVVDSCLVEKREPVEYAALSYIWGSFPNFRLTQANKPRLMRPGVLHSVWPLLPRTIRDAVSLCRVLRIRFLWVDSLCLVQNDYTDLEPSIRVMDRIYEHAWLTIVAAHGHDANAGLPGVQEGDRHEMECRPHGTVEPGVVLGASPSLKLRLMGSLYQTRAWTLQEHELSRRRLYFFKDEVIFCCRGAECHESWPDDPTRWGSKEIPSSLLSDTQTIHMGNSQCGYDDLLRGYTKRQMTNESDVLNALAGIIERFTQCYRFPMLAGLPVGTFDWFLLFQGERLRRRRGFPSFSWAGWRGKLNFSYSAVEMNEWLRDQTWIIWYKRDSAGALSLIWDPLENKSFPLEDMTFKGYRERTPFSCPVPSIDTSRTTPTQNLVLLPDNTPESSCLSPVLQFWTLVVYLKIQDLGVFRADGSLVGMDGVILGNTSLDGLDDATTFFDSENPVEVVLLSQRPRNILDRRRGHRYYAMIIEWNNGVAERRGLGVIEHDAVRQSFSPGPVWKEIVLG